MAMSIKEIPVLTGQCAVDFVSAADANSQNQTPKLTTQQADRIKDVMEKSKSFSFSNQKTMAEGFSLYDNCVMMQLSDKVFANCDSFTCGNADLDDFFINDAKRYANELMGKTYCWITDNKTGCRFLVVDAYNTSRTLNFYERNGFKFLHKDEEEERKYYRICGNDISTRLMYFDLKVK